MKGDVHPKSQSALQLRHVHGEKFPDFIVFGKKWKGVYVNPLINMPSPLVNITEGDAAYVINGIK